MIVKRCANGHENVFDQPWAYHAGFSDVGFLYNDAGDLTLVWSVYDLAYQALVGHLPSGPDGNSARHALVDASLRPAPHGGRWRHGNPPRCLTCQEPIQIAPGQPIYFVVYPGSVDVQDFRNGAGFASVLRGDLAAT